MSIHLAQKTWIVLLISKKVTILAKYLDYIKIFLKKLIAKLFKCSDINKYIMNLDLDKQLLYKLIYNLEFVKLEIIKTYIKIDLVNSFIQSFKSSIRAFILFI